jgi:hypothetical protein
MATIVEKTDVKATRFVSTSSRYAESQVLLYGSNKLPTFETYKRATFKSSDSDRFAIVPAGEEYRPDLTSFRAYGTVDYWWQILEANNISDVFNYKAGRNIRLPQPYNTI